ncbi:MAG: ABC transporter permease [Planctomycetota bacterium]
MYKLFLCGRYLTTRPIGLVSIISVMLGVGVMIIVNSIMGGFHAKTRERLHGILADIIVESTTMDGFSDPVGVMHRIEELVGDKVVAMAPDVEVFAMLHYQNQGRGRHLTRPIRLVGILPEGRAAVGEFKNHLLDPENQKNPSFNITKAAQTWRDEHPEYLVPDTPTPPGAIVGYQIATFRGRGMSSDQFMISPGQEIIVTTVTTGKPQPTDARFTVTDFFKCDMSEYDSNYVFVPIETLQRLRGMNDAVSSIQIKLKDYADAPLIVETLQSALPRAYFQVDTWEDKQGPLLQAVKVEVFLLNLILFFIIAVAGFGILAIFFMIVVEKTHDIGTLKALGRLPIRE